MRRATIALLTCTLSGLAACGGGAVTTLDADASSTDVPVTIDSATGEPGDVEDPGCVRCEVPEAADESGPFETVDVEIVDVEIVDVEVPTDCAQCDEGVEPDAGECTGAYMCACTTNTECYSGLCVATMDGHVCTKQCGLGIDCPPGWGCENVSLGEPIYACVLRSANLCRPCRIDADCVPLGGGDLDYKCIDVGPSGKVCGSGCEGAGDCPDGFDCMDVAEGRASVKQCRPASGDCPCTERFKKEGFETTCWVANGDGRCEASRTCDQACTAATPSAETCNKTDDDCDGQTDEGTDGLTCVIPSTYGSCEGLTVCAGGTPLCQGTAAQAEVCNGLDEDCDGQTDEEGAAGCGTFYKDGDRDGFGVESEARCLCAAVEPYDSTDAGDCDDTRAAGHPGGTETCNGLDDDCDGQTDEDTLAQCFPTVCSTPLGVCKPTCAGPEDCQAGYACDAGTCRKVPGQSCLVDGECAGGFCSDGVCCLSRCGGICERCDLAPSPGTCAPVSEGADPDEECAPSEASTCGLTGACSGLPSCALWRSGTVCAGTTCDDSTTSHLAATCDGSGTCVDQGTVACAPLLCDPDSGLCLKECAGDQDCDAGFVCASKVCKRADGQGCGGDAECASGFCTDTVCCHVRCDGICERCDPVDALGTCTALAGETDPDDECEASGVDTCGLTGQCSGFRFCALWAAGSACTAPACEGAGSSRLPSLCDGDGTCNTGDLQDCFPYQCDPETGLCRVDCSEDDHCRAGHACAGGACRKVDGEECDSGTDCASGACVDGVCCDTPCDALCAACDLPDSVGTCTHVAGGEDPDLECPDLAASTCGTVGACSGEGTCTLYGPGTVCASRTCASLYDSFPADTCDGAGLCQDSGLVQCFPYLCELVTGACRSTCGTSADCQAGYTCTSGTCLKSEGEACVGDGECARGFCTDGACCEARCGGICESCAQSGRVGRCDPVPSGEDPDGECADSGALSCGTTGTCSGGRTCALALPGTVCHPPLCLDSTTAAPADTCNGTGSCVDQGTVLCGAFGCDPVSGACRTTCTIDDDCQSGYVCAGTTCKKDEGEGCAVDGDCASGFCTDRVCCQSRCGGNCESCNGAGRAGFCDPVPVDSDPDGECSLDAVSSCGRNGSCSGSRSCALHASGTQCLQAVCVNTITSDPADACDGNGLCVDSPTADCQPYTCDGATGVCRTVCSGAGDCAPGFACAGGVCRRAPGQNCAVDGDCASGFCTDGVCCRSRCEGLCEACDQPGRAGYCDAVPLGQDPDEECAEEPASSCGQTGLCSGARTCSRQPGGAACSTAVCAGPGTSILPDVCDGSGTCIDAGTVPCAPYTCNPTTGLCRTTCGGPGECAANYECVGGVCRKSRGQSCFTDDECAGGFCTDGYCCTARCGGTCEACDAQGREGYCDAVAAGSDPDTECPVDGAASCDRTGDCSGARTCALYTPETVCAAAVCVGDTSFLADTCDGAGTCGDAGSQACFPYTCNPGTGLCRSSCGDGGDCQAGYSCVSGTCRKDAGQACNAGTECSTGACCSNICRDLTSDADHCGGCGTVCQQVNGTNSCVASTCTPACDAGFDSCDGNRNNGCEQPLDTLAHCGACNTGCARDNAAESCATRTCVLGACDPGWANCDSNSANGCELDLASDTNVSGSAESIGEIRGDIGSDFASTSNRRSRWFLLHVAEGDSGLFAQGFSATVNLVSPSGADYNLYVYGACSGGLLASSASTSAVDSVTVGWKEHWANAICIGGCEDGQDLWVYVKWNSGSGCGSYTLSATGNTNSDDSVVCQCDSCPFD